MKHAYLLFILIFAFSCIQEKEEGIDYLEYSALEDSAFNKVDSITLTDIELPEKINFLQFDTATVDIFHRLAESTGGKAYFAANANLVVETIIDVINTHGSDDIDLCFLIDKTGSMVDDIQLMQISMDKIFSAIKAYKDVNLSLAYYGDRNVDGKYWLEIHNFTKDFDKLERNFKRVRYSGGGDAPESVTDAAFQVIKRLKWSSQNKRVILILGDAPSLVPPLARNTLDEVIESAKEQKIAMNFYPIIVGFADNRPGPSKENLISIIYPNPSRGIINIVFENKQEYLIEVFNSKNSLIYTTKTNDIKHRINLATQKDGLYIVRTLTAKNSSVDIRKIILQK